MSVKDICFTTEAKSTTYQVLKRCVAVSVTLGPKGRNVMIQKSFGGPRITKDGVSVANEIELENAVENIGAQAVKEVSAKTNEQAGDGTTTSIILAESIVRQSLKHAASGLNPILVKRGLDKACELVINNIKSIARDVSDRKDLEQVATISANGESEIGTLIADAMDKVGRDGVITCEEGKSFQDELTVVEGMQFDRGYLSPYFTTNSEKMLCDLENPYILLTDKKVSTIKDLVPVLEKVSQSGRPLMIIAEDIDGEALATLVVNKLRGVLKVCAVKAPGFGDRRKAMLQDIAVLTGGQVISDEMGLKLEDTMLEQLGQANTITISKDETTIVGGSGQKDALNERLDQIKFELSQATSDYDKEKLQERMAKLSGGVLYL